MKSLKTLMLTRLTCLIWRYYKRQPQLSAAMGPQSASALAIARVAVVAVSGEMAGVPMRRNAGSHQSTRQNDQALALLGFFITALRLLLQTTF